MQFADTQARWIMLVAGALTFTMIQAASAPHAALIGMFGGALGGPIAGIIVRNRGRSIAVDAVMVGLFGLQLRTTSKSA